MKMSMYFIMIISSVPPARSHSQPKVELEPPLPLKVETSVKKGMTRYSRSTPLLNSEKRYFKFVFMLLWYNLCQT
jgi:hypothetical protein